MLGRIEDFRYNVPMTIKANKILVRFGPWLLAIGGTLGLAGLIFTTYPTPPVRLLFLYLLFVAVFGLAVIVLRSAYRHRLPAEIRRRDPYRIMREGLMAAGFVVICAWLRILDVLTWTNALLLLGVLMFMEAFWISRTE